MIDIRKPFITSPQLSGQVEQMRSYLFGLAEQLNYYLNNLSGSGGTIVIDSSDEVKNAKALYAAIKEQISDDFLDDKTFENYVTTTKETLDALNAFMTGTRDSVAELKTEKVGDIDYSIRRWQSGYTEITGIRPSASLSGIIELKLPTGLSSVTAWNVVAESPTKDYFVCTKSADATAIKVKVFEWGGASLDSAALRISVKGIWKEEI